MDDLKKTKLDHYFKVTSAQLEAIDQRLLKLEWAHEGLDSSHERGDYPDLKGLAHNLMGEIHGLSNIIARLPELIRGPLTDVVAELHKVDDSKQKAKAAEYVDQAFNRRLESLVDHYFTKCVDFSVMVETARRPGIMLPHNDRSLDRAVDMAIRMADLHVTRVRKGIDKLGNDESLRDKRWSDITDEDLESLAKEDDHE